MGSSHGRGIGVPHPVTSSESSSLSQASCPDAQGWPVYGDQEALTDLVAEEVPILGGVAGTGVT